MVAAHLKSKNCVRKPQLFLRFLGCAGNFNTTRFCGVLKGFWNGQVVVRNSGYLRDTGEESCITCSFTVNLLGTLLGLTHSNKMGMFSFCFSLSYQLLISASKVCSISLIGLWTFYWFNWLFGNKQLLGVLGTCVFPWLWILLY